MKNFLLEACVDSVESAIAAMKGGADRLELCAGLVIGGISPTTALYEAVLEVVDIPIHVLVRPRFGDFCYTDYEFDIMLREVRHFRKLGAAGVVVGVLNSDGTLDVPRLRMLVEEAGPMRVTLHRCFDVCSDPLEALETARSLGIRSILTSGQKGSAIEGAPCIAKLVEASGENLEILVAAGVSPENIPTIYGITGAKAYHMSGKVTLESPMVYRNPKVHMGVPGMGEYEIWRTAKDNIQRTREALVALG